MLKSINIKNVLIAIFVLFIVWAALFIYSNPVIGVSRENLEQNVRETCIERGFIDSDWHVAQAINDSVAVFLFYDEVTKDYVYTSYVNHPAWWSFGYFGQGFNKNDDDVANNVQGYRYYGNYDNYVRVFSMNKPQIARMEYGAEGEDKTMIEVDPDQPFALILPQDYGTITLYDRDGNIPLLEYAETPLTFIFADRSE